MSTTNVSVAHVKPNDELYSGLHRVAVLGPSRAGFKPDRTLFGKNVGVPPSHKFSDINVQKHSVDTCFKCRYTA